MYVRRTRRFSRKPRPTGRRYGRRMGGRKKTGIRKMVRSMISRSQETKQLVSNFNSGILSQTTAGNVVSNTQYMLPAFVQGTGMGQRIGDKVSISNFAVKGMIGIANAATSTTAWHARVVIFSVKDYNQESAGTNLPTIEASNFFRTGGTTTSANGYVFNEGLLPINKQRINVYYDKSFICGTDYGTKTVNSNSTIPSQHKFYCNLRKHFKTLKFDENGTYPTLALNADCWITVFWNPIDSQVGSGTATGTLNFMTDIRYKDA